MPGLPHLSNMSWVELTPEQLPPRYAPVLLRLRARSPISGINSGKILGGHEYGYRLGVLVCQEDGFGRPHPDFFQEFCDDGEKEGPQLRNRIHLKSVSHWALLT